MQLFLIKYEFIAILARAINKCFIENGAVKKKSIVKEEILKPSDTHIYFWKCIMSFSFIW